MDLASKNKDYAASKFIQNVRILQDVNVFAIMRIQKISRTLVIENYA